jgi:hypothetical protein
MFDCSEDLLCYHDDHVSLPQKDRSAMRKRRDANRDRLKDGLRENEDPQPIMFCKQGSYAMLTMVQHPDNDYDIDDGVYFEMDDLVGPRGGEMSPLDVRNMVRDAVDDGSFTTAPEVRSNCVRIYYVAGYHVDMPAYRKRIETTVSGEQTEIFELASSNWKRSDARLVTDWFNTENAKQSPDKDNGRQLRRMTRYLKDFAQSRGSWCGKIASGFAITKLVTECYKPSEDREDTALRDTMVAIRDRLLLSLIVDHPTTPNETISKGDDDPKIRFLREKLDQAVDDLAILDSSDCTAKKALKAWDKVFQTDFFSLRVDTKMEEKKKAASVFTTGILGTLASGPQEPVRKEGGGRFA